MLGSRIGRSSRLLGWLIVVGAFGPLLAWGEAPPEKPFVVPKDRAEWEARRPMILFEVEGSSPRKRFPPLSFAPSGSLGTPPGDVIVEQVVLPPPGPYDPKPPVPEAHDPIPNGIFVRPAQAKATNQVPLVVLVTGHHQHEIASMRSGYDGRSPALALAQFGFAVLSTDATLPEVLDAVLARPEIDRSRVAVLGLGQTGMTALWLMAVDPRIKCGAVAIESRTAALRVVQADGQAPIFEELAALCAPRPLCLMIGEPLPLPPPAKSIGRTLERAAKGTYQVFGKEGAGLTFTLFGEFAGHDSVDTRLQWMAGLEHLDKHLRPQGPTPLGHAPEAEPRFDPTDDQVLNLSAHGIAGWSSEMSFRDSTWTWNGGVVTCRPGPHEYGWLRSPVEVTDFLLQVEWKVPERGNAGIFLRARPVDWILPPTEENRLRVAALGLTWPSRTGLELQTQADPGEANRYSTGSLYRHAAPCANPTKPGEWNRSTVRARGPRVEVWNNGMQVLDADLNRSGDTLPNPPLKGYIGLQNHGTPAEYRSIRLKRLPPEPEGTQGAAKGSPGSIVGGKASR